MKHILLTWLTISSLLILSSCAISQEHPLPEPQPGWVTDLDAFAAFIATTPTPTDFRTVYPDVHLVVPGDITTQEYRTNNSRFYAELDAEGRVIAGEFR